ncbi:MAG: family 43 glycosylhydrolase [Clostridia bacterium]|nr:family 43 glycosylhydrolase [Clostridia bacterium]
MKNCDINIRDPFVLVVDGKYYMYGTRAANFGQGTGGFDVYIGDDLENWSEPKEIFSSVKHNMNTHVNWAPEVHFYNGAYYLLATFTKPNGLRGTYILKSEAPDGEFELHSDGAVTPKEWECLDGTLHFENGKVYCVFCHEHTQILNGTICRVELSNDLTHAVTEPVELFAASSFLNREATEKDHNVTDGPFLYRKENGKLIMIWSTCCNGYRQCVATSDNGSICGNWTHLPTLFDDDGGHGMIFKDLNGELRLTLHCPNISLEEHPVFFRLTETDDSVKIND